MAITHTLEALCATSLLYRYRTGNHYNPSKRAPMRSATTVDHAIFVRFLRPCGKILVWDLPIGRQEGRKMCKLRSCLVLTEELDSFQLLKKIGPIGATILPLL